ncbi:hypothetical protein BBJ28_00007054 [Nothophytophthora sp. Chile5]|nr:hypothetical protein BBJ28_00007054 [Nothophytophthora sp. Chile5]
MARECNHRVLTNASLASFDAQSLPTDGGTGRDSFGSIPTLASPPYSPTVRSPPSYSISRASLASSGASSAATSVIGRSRKRSISGDSLSAGPSRLSFAPAASCSAHGSATVYSSAVSRSPASLKCVLAVPPKPKRLRREPLSPTSVGEVSDTKKMPAAKTATAPAAAAVSPGAAQMQSMLRGLQHLSVCGPSGCANPLCVSTRAFLEKVTAHRSSMASKPGHESTRCGACKLWTAIEQQGPVKEEQTVRMVLKFCSPSWMEAPAAVRTSNHELGEDYAPAGGRRSVAERAWDELLDSASREEGEPKLWEKEFRVFFDDSKPVGLGFQPVAVASSSSSSNSFDIVQADSYVCAVREVAPVGLAADYNARCRASSDYSRVIVEKLRVRMVNGHDVAQVPYADVLQM